MGLKCEFSGKITDNEYALFCKDCGNRFVITEIDFLKNIYNHSKKNDEIIERLSKIQIKIGLVTAIITACALMFSIGSLLMVWIGLLPDQRLVGLAIILLMVFFVYLIIKGSKIYIDLDEIEEIIMSDR